MSIEHGFRSAKIFPLSFFPDGLHGTIVGVVADVDLQGRLMGMGIFAGTRFQLLRRGSIASNIPFLLAVDETRIAIDHKIAEMILVEV